MATGNTPQGRNEGDIELGHISTPIEDPISQAREILVGEPSSQVPAADETESYRYPRLPQFRTHMEHMETPPSPQVQAACETQRNEPSQTMETPPNPKVQAARGGPLFSENRELSVGLYKAALNGDWETAKGLFGNDRPDREILCASITKGLETALHVAAGAGQTKFVEKLIGFMEPEDLELRDKNGNTAFCLAAAAGAKSIAEIMIKENPNLPKVRGNQELTPLYMAATYGQCEVVRFLHPKTEDILEREANEGIETKDRTGTDLFFAYIDIGLFDLALKLLTRDSGLAVIRYDDRGTVLHMLARMPSAFPSKGPGIWKTLINSCMTSKQKRKLNQADDALELVKCLWKNVLERDDYEVLELIRESPTLLSEAAKSGNFKFLAELVCLYPSLIWEVDENGHTIFHIALLHRHVNIFSQIHKIGSIKDTIAAYNGGSNNTILHLAALLPHSSRLNVVPGAALQLQRELIWFQEVEKIVQPSSREKRNLDGLTPRELFTKEHKDLLKEAEKWLNGKARSCILIATIITTVVFAAAFSQPGGNNGIEGTPNHPDENWFQVFGVSDAIAFSCSLSSTLLFWSIPSSRYTEKAFLKLLPCKLMAGLLTLFISVIAMMITFTSAFVVTYNHKKGWGPMLISAMAILPAVVLIVWPQYSLFVDTFKSTFLSKSLFQRSKPMIC